MSSAGLGVAKAFKRMRSAQSHAQIDGQTRLPEIFQGSSALCRSLPASSHRLIRRHPLLSLSFAGDHEAIPLAGLVQAARKAMICCYPDDPLVASRKEVTGLLGALLLAA